LFYLFFFLDHVLSVLANVRLQLAQGGPKRGLEALGAVEELQEKFGPTALTLTLAGEAALVCNRPEEAEQSLKVALSHDPHNTACLYALHVALLQQGKTQLAGRALAQAKSSPGSAKLAFVTQAETEFDAVAEKK
jgi:predicted Zn-dependent protease